METDAYIVSCLSVFSPTLSLCLLFHTLESNSVHYSGFIDSSQQCTVESQLSRLSPLPKGCFTSGFKRQMIRGVVHRLLFLSLASSYFSLSLTICRCVPSLLAMKWIESGLSVTECGYFLVECGISLFVALILWKCNCEDSYPGLYVLNFPSLTCECILACQRHDREIPRETDPMSCSYSHAVLAVDWMQQSIKVLL